MICATTSESSNLLFGVLLPRETIQALKYSDISFHGSTEGYQENTFYSQIQIFDHLLKYRNMIRFSHSHFHLLLFYVLFCVQIQNFWCTHFVYCSPPATKRIQKCVSSLSRQVFFWNISSCRSKGYFWIPSLVFLFFLVER